MIVTDARLRELRSRVRDKLREMERQPDTGKAAPYTTNRVEIAWLREQLLTTPPKKEAFLRQLYAVGKVLLPSLLRPLQDLDGKETMFLTDAYVLVDAGPAEQCCALLMLYSQRLAPEGSIERLAYVMHKLRATLQSVYHLRNDNAHLVLEGQEDVDNDTLYFGVRHLDGKLLVATEDLNTPWQARAPCVPEDLISSLNECRHGLGMKL